VRSSTPDKRVVAVSDMGAKAEQAMKNAAKLERKELKADTAAIENDAKAAQTDEPASTSDEGSTS
jgi:hypothetical protein